MNQEQLKTQKISITERTPRGQFIEYTCNGLIDAFTRFGSGVRDEDIEEFEKEIWAFQDKINPFDEELAKLFNNYTENVVHVEFIE